MHPDADEAPGHAIKRIRRLVFPEQGLADAELPGQAQARDALQQGGLEAAKQEALRQQLGAHRQRGEAGIGRGAVGGTGGLVGGGDADLLVKRFTT